MHNLQNPDVLPNFEASSLIGVAGKIFLRVISKIILS
jgi:hypothetical protein